MVTLSSRAVPNKRPPPNAEQETMPSNNVSEGDSGSMKATVEDSAKSQFMLSDISFGEQLVLETFLRCRQRPYSRKRQDELARPRRQKQQPDDLPELSISSPSVKLDKVKLDEIVNRLSRPRFLKDTVDEHSVSKDSQSQQRSRRSDADVAAIIERLSKHKPPRAVLEAQEREAEAVKNAATPRPVNHVRLASLATPLKRGGSCQCWGVRPDWTRETGSIVSSERTLPSLRCRSAGDAGSGVSSDFYSDYSSEIHRNQMVNSAPAGGLNILPPVR